MAGLWVARSKAFSRSCTRFRSESKARSEFAISRLSVGPWARITFGSLASARAMGTCMAVYKLFFVSAQGKFWICANRKFSRCGLYRNNQGELAGDGLWRRSTR
jgi:hypothetical protein